MITLLHGLVTEGYGTVTARQVATLYDAVRLPCGTVHLQYGSDCEHGTALAAAWLAPTRVMLVLPRPGLVARSEIMNDILAAHPCAAALSLFLASQRPSRTQQLYPHKAPQVSAADLVLPQEKSCNCNLNCCNRGTMRASTDIAPFAHWASQRRRVSFIRSLVVV